VVSDLHIEGADISSLGGLAAIVSVGGDFSVSETFNLANLDGCNSRLEILYGKGAPEDPFLAVPVFSALSAILLTGLVLLAAVMRLRHWVYK